MCGRMRRTRFLLSVDSFVGSSTLRENCDLDGLMEVAADRIELAIVVHRITGSKAQKSLRRKSGQLWASGEWSKGNLYIDFIARLARGK